MKIADVRVFKVRGPKPEDAFPTGDRQSQSLDIYPEFNAKDPRVATPRAPSGNSSIVARYVEIESDEGHRGIFGPIQEEQAFVILKFLRPFLIGRDPMATELLLDQMLRLNRHGRSGIFMTGVSPVDCALWDLKGKAFGMPVYRLLGGPTRERVPAYASMLGFSVDPDDVRTLAREYREKGYTAQKWFFRYGPIDGERGLERNLAMARAAREAVGPHYPLMFDAFMGWDVTYALKMLAGLEPLQPHWMEEPIPPERVESLKRLAQASSVPIATGEHVYTRWQVKELLQHQAVAVVQTDPDWTGGITELVKICSLASAFDVPVVAHGHSLLPALHVAAAQSPSTVPYVEFLIRGQVTKQHFHKPIYWPENGSLALPTLPGLGLVLDESKIESREEVGYAS